MGHVVLSGICFILWTLALNLMGLGLLLAYKRASGSALLFAVGMACLVLLMALGIQAHVDIAHSFRYASMTLPLGVLLLLKRTQQKAALAPLQKSSGKRSQRSQ